MVQFLKYIALRLLIGTFVAMVAVFYILAWVHESLYADGALDDRNMIIWLYLTVLLAVSGAMSLWGRVRFHWMLERELDRLSRQYDPGLLELAWRRLDSFLGSCFFFNTSRERNSRVVNRRFGDILLGMRAEDDQAMSIYEKVLAAEPDNESYFSFLVRAWSRRPRLTEPSLAFVRRRFHERPDDRLVGILSREYTLRGVLNFESERVLERCLQVYPEHRRRVLEFAVPRMLSFKRTDDNAVRFYLAALDQGEWADRILPVLESLQERYNEKKRSDALAVAVARAVRGGVGEGSRKEWNGLLDVSFSPSPARDALDPVGLVYQPEEELGRQRVESGLSPGSLVFQSLQRLFAGGRGAVGGGWRRLRLLLFVILSAVLVYFIVSSGERVLDAFRPSRPESGDSGFIIRADVFRDSLEAAAMAGKLSSIGEMARVSVASSGGKRLFSVEIGPFHTDSAATAEAQKLAADGHLKDWKVVSGENR